MPMLAELLQDKTIPYTNCKSFQALPFFWTPPFGCGNPELAVIGIRYQCKQINFAFIIFIELIAMF